MCGQKTPPPRFYVLPGQISNIQTNAINTTWWNFENLTGSKVVSVLCICSFFWCIVSVPLSVYFPTVFVEASLFIPLFQHNHAPLSISLTSWNCQNYISSSFCLTSMFRQFTRGFAVCGKIYNVSRLPSGYLRSGPSPREHSVTSPSGEQQWEGDSSY